MRDKRDEPTGVKCERINDKFGGEVTSEMNETGERCGGRWFGDERQLETQTLSPPKALKDYPQADDIINIEVDTKRISILSRYSGQN